jgi:hypothetical protein
MTKAWVDQMKFLSRYVNEMELIALLCVEWCLADLTVDMEVWLVYGQSPIL